MRALLLITVLAAAGCNIDPVIMSADQHETACKDASRDYCRHVVRASSDDMRECVARHTYECAAGKR